MLIATLQGESFGQGVHDLAAVENALVLCLLFLLTAVIAVTACFVQLARRNQTRLPEETVRLLDELAEAPATPPSASPTTPWEREGDWWKSGPPPG